MSLSATVVIVSLLVGVSASFAFVGPATPFQLQGAKVSAHRAETVFPLAANVDPWLDNPLIEIDMNIVPARKCSVCIGVSHTLRFHSKQWNVVYSSVAFCLSDSVAELVVSMIGCTSAFCVELKWAGERCLKFSPFRFFLS